jgi:hypothetical protein
MRRTSNGRAAVTFPTGADSGVHRMSRLTVVSSIVLVALAPRSDDREKYAERVADLAKSAPPLQIARGDRSLAGRVLSDVGEPVAGVLVRATRHSDLPLPPWSWPIVEEPPPSSSLADTLKQSVDGWYRARESVREATTDGDGRYLFADLLDGDYDLEAYVHGFEVSSVAEPTQRRTLVHAGSTSDFFATPTALQRFDVRAADGSPATQAMLIFDRVGSGGWQRPVTWTPDRPATLVAAGDWYVTAIVGGRDRFTADVRLAKFASKRQLVTVAPPREPPLVTLRLHGVRAIEGSVTSEHALASPLAVVGVLLHDGQEPDPGLLLRDQSPRYEPRVQVQFSSVDWSSATGRHYRLEGLAPGRWYVGVRTWYSKHLLASAVVSLGEECVVHDFALPRIEDEERTVVRVLDTDGRPLRHCVFEYRGPGAAGGLLPDRTSDGSFSFPTSLLPVGTTLFVVSPRLGRRRVQLAAGEHDATVRFDEPALVTLRMPDFAGNSRGRAVSLEVEPGVQDDSTRSDTIRPDEIAADGTVELGGMQPGTWRIRVVSDPDPDDHASGFVVATASVELASGPRELSLPFPKLAELRLVAAKEFRGPFVLSPCDGDPADSDRTRRHGESDLEGIVKFVDVPPGRYVVRSSGNDLMFLEAPQDALVRFAPAAVRALRVVIDDRSGPLARAGLATGDLVVAVDGREFADRHELDAIQKNLKAATVTLTVERAGERFEVVIANEDLHGRPAAGGRFEEAVR